MILDKLTPQVKEALLEYLQGVEDYRQAARITIPAHAIPVLWPHFVGETREVFVVLGINIDGRVVLNETLFTGAISECTVDLKIIFRRLLETGATRFMTAHNHPSGSVERSGADNSIFNRMDQAGRLMGIENIDNYIFSTKEMWSQNADTVLRISRYI